MTKKIRRDKQPAKSANKSLRQSTPSSAPESGQNVESVDIASTRKSIARRVEFWVVLALIAASLFVYAPVRHYGFVLYDDLQYVGENSHVLDGPTMQNVQWAFTTDRAGFWMPATWLSHMFDARLFGSATGPQHVTNVVFHIVNSLLLFGILRRLTSEWKPSAFVAALFAVHPLHVESVAWIAERKDVLSTFFWMLALWAYSTYVRRTGPGRYLLVLLCFGLGMMAKPTLVTLPFGLLLLDIWPLRRLRIEGGQQQVWLHLVLEKLPLIAMSLAISAVTLEMSVAKRTIAGSDSLSIPLRLANASVSYATYIRDMFWPADLAAFYPMGPLPAWEVAGSLLGLLAVTAFVIWNFRRYAYLLVGWLWYLGTLVPVIGLVQAGGQSHADRFTYMPLVGLFIAGTWGVAHLAGRWKYHQIVLSAAAGVLICGFAIEARRQVEFWENGLTLWQHALDTTTDNFLAHSVLGLALANEGRIDEAVIHYREALRIQPDFAMAHNNLGIALGRQGKAGEAIAEFRAAINTDIGKAEFHYNLGFELADQRRFDEAIVQYTEALRLNPDYLAALTKRGDAFLMQGKASEAIADYAQTIRSRPDSTEALNNLGLALVSQGRYEEGIARYNEALRIQPDFADAHNNLGAALANQGNYDDALSHFREALRFRPDYPQARDNLAQALSIRGTNK